MKNSEVLINFIYLDSFDVNGSIPIVLSDIIFKKSGAMV